MARTQEEQEFVEACFKFREGTTFREYCEEIERVLTLSTWHYGLETVKKLMEGNMDYVTTAYAEKEPPYDTTVRALRSWIPSAPTSSYFRDVWIWPVSGASQHILG